MNRLTLLSFVLTLLAASSSAASIYGRSSLEARSLSRNVHDRNIDDIHVILPRDIDHRLAQLEATVHRLVRRTGASGNAAASTSAQGAASNRKPNQPDPKLYKMNPISKAAIKTSLMGISSDDLAKRQQKVAKEQQEALAKKDYSKLRDLNGESVILNKAAIRKSQRPAATTSGGYAPLPNQNLRVPEHKYADVVPFKKEKKVTGLTEHLGDPSEYDVQPATGK